MKIVKHEELYNVVYLHVYPWSKITCLMFIPESWASHAYVAILPSTNVMEHHPVGEDDGLGLKYYQKMNATLYRCVDEYSIQTVLRHHGWHPRPLCSCLPSGL